MNNTERLYLVKTASRELLGQLALMGGGGAALGGGLGALTGLFTDDGVLRGAGKGALTGLGAGVGARAGGSLGKAMIPLMTGVKTVLLPT